MMFSFTPTVLTKYPRDQNFLPQYFLRISGISLYMRMATRPLIVPIASLTANFGGMERTK